MTVKYRSSVFFQSNVLPVEDTFHDPRFLSKISDPFALERLNADPAFKLTQLSPLQQEILNKCGIHCIYAEKGDYPWGIPVGASAEAKPICLCTQTGCAIFSKCRPDFISQNNKNTGEKAGNHPVEPVPFQKTDTDTTCFSEEEEQSLLLDPEPQCVDDDFVFEPDVAPLATPPRSATPSSPMSDDIKPYTDTTCFGEEEEHSPLLDPEPRCVDGDFVFEPDVAPLATPLRNATPSSTMSDDIVLEEEDENVQNSLEEIVVPPDIRQDNVPGDKDDFQEEAGEKYHQKIAPAVALTACNATQEPVIDDVPPSSASATPCVEYGLPGCQSFEDFIQMDQAAVIDLAASARVLVNAPPGTGKTWTLIQRIRHLVENEEVKPEQILVLTFTRAATAVIRERIGDASKNGTEITDIDTGTFDSFAFTLLNQCREAYPELCPNTVGMQYEDGIRAATKLITSCREQPLIDGYAHVIIDEIQDLSGSRALLVMALLASLPSGCGYTLLGDSCQSIYDWRQDNGGSQIFSADLYKWLMSPARGISRYISFSKDYRKCGGGLPDTTDYRRAILAGEKSGIEHHLTPLLRKLKPPVADLKTATLRKIVKSHPENETLGILTRSNGMALVVSSQLSYLGVAHTRLRKTRGETLANWIADIFVDWNHKTIHRDEFSEKFMELYGKTENEEMAHACWNALAKGRTSGRQEVCELLAAIQRNRDPLLWRQAGAVRPSIEVSNVFKAKGREYDNVFLIDELFQRSGPFGDDDGAMTADEDRVRYVGLTRARKQMFRLPNPPASDFLYKDKLCGERVFKSGRIRGKGFRPKYIAFFEFGIDGDIVPESFATMSSAQEYIVQFAKDGADITLEKLPSNRTNGIPIYEVCILNGDTKHVIGFSGISFKESLERSLRRIYGNPNKNIPFRSYPDSISEIYVTGRSSHVSVWESKLKGATRFEDWAVWRGIGCQGFGVTH